jgi:hypothetical protein
LVGSDSPQLEVFVTSPLTPVGVEVLPTPTYGLLSDYGFAFGAGPDFVVWDLRDGRASPMRELSRCAGCASNAWRVQALFPRVYTAGGYWLRVFDVTDPESPRLTHTLESPRDRIYDAAPFADGTVAIANDHFGFRLLMPNRTGGFDSYGRRCDRSR